MGVFWKAELPTFEARLKGLPSATHPRPTRPGVREDPLDLEGLLQGFATPLSWNRAAPFLRAGAVSRV